MILWTSILAVISLLCLIPQTQIMISNLTGVTRRKIVFIGLGLIAVWDYAVFKSLNFSFGLVCLAISITMMLIVPRSERVQRWMREILFEGEDILDKDAPYAGIVSLFKFPLLCLGIWLAIPWALPLVEIVPVLIIFGIYLYKINKLPKVIKDVIDRYVENDEVSTDKENVESANDGASTTV